MMISHSNVKLPDAMVVNWVLYTTDDMLNIIMVWTSIGSAAFSSSRFPSLSGKQWLSSRQTQGVLHPRSSNPEKIETRIYY